MSCAIRIMAEAAPLVVVLAAGLATRFGGGKLDADCAGKPLGQWAIDAVAAAGLAPGFIVVGQQVPAFARASGWSLLINPEPEAGLGGSVALAATAALEQRRDLLLMLADMPLIGPDYLNRLALYREAVATRHPDGRAGVPVRLPLATLPQAALITGERGAAAMLAGIEGLVLLEPSEGMLADVDCAGDLSRVAEALTPRA